MQQINSKLKITTTSVIAITLLLCVVTKETVVAQHLPKSPDLWDFTPATIDTQKKSLLDLSYLNEETAGQHGWVRRSVDGNSFVRGDGAPIRFWAVGSTVYRQGRSALQQHAKFLAKFGVNMARWHGNINPKGKLTNFHDIDDNALDQLFQYVAAMKQAGIYLTLSPYYPHATKREGYNKMVDDSWPIPRNKQANNTGSLLFFDPTLQRAYKRWIHTLFTRKNPYTGIALKDEPAIAIFQIQNEDSLLFWTFNALQGADLDLLRQQYGSWLINKYHKLATAQQAWQGAKPLGSKVSDDWQRGLISFISVHHLTKSNNTAKLHHRLKDQTEFLTETMRNWNAEVVRFLREEIGTPVLVNAGNWKTASPLLLNDLERYSYTSAEVIASNRYVTSLHKGANRGWAISNGQSFTDESVLTHPEKLPVALKQVSGHPIIVTESSWVAPISYQAEGPFLTSIMQSLNGVDGLYWFNAGVPEWQAPASANGYLPSLGKWTIQTPMIMGQFPAAALSYRLGLVKEGEAVIDEVRPLDDLYQRKIPLISESGSFDPNRDQGFTSPTQGITAPIDQKAFLLGPVNVSYGGDRQSTSVNHNALQQLTNATITSITEQISWDTKQGIAIVDSPSSQGACGFFDHKPIYTTDATFTVTNHYACVWLVAMDDKPIRHSEKILVQMGTRQFPSNWTTTTKKINEKGKQLLGQKILSYGQAPWQIEQLFGQLNLNNPQLTKAQILTANGMLLNEQPLTHKNGRITLDLPQNALHMILK